MDKVVADIIERLEETGQAYIVGHDTPVSISTSLFELLEARRRKTAEALGIPEEQYEFEDLIFRLLQIEGQEVRSR